MAKGQQRSNREVRKPKKDKDKPASSAPVSSFTNQMKTAETSGTKKR
ncbi:hypothetical protein [Rhizobium sp. CECT 9324]|jgi:hypothetical protein|nr:hypothetical protein [Rhizobium sp. CECT 9324]CAH0338742.1 hypothetical protein RHI9324_00368 [Rhizobium sp. CECT 9324]